jgi:hypothetical protein
MFRIVTSCDGTCDGSSFCKWLIINICDGVTAQKGGGGGRQKAEG